MIASFTMSLSNQRWSTFVSSSSVFGQPSTDGEWFVYDVIADGVSLVRNYRGQFDKIIRESGYPELVEELRKKSKEAKPPKPKK